MVKLGNPSQFDFYFGASKETIEYAKALRKRMTPSEAILWDNLRNRKLFNTKFRRQHPIERFIVDFYCPAKKIVIELDGGIHDDPDQKEYDIGRSAEIEKYDIKIIRFKNEEIIDDLDKTLKKIIELIK